MKVEDDRKFQDKPASADIPSLKGEQSNATVEEKARAVARKRNGYGKALGDILLKDETVHIWLINVFLMHCSSRDIKFLLITPLMKPMPI